MTFFYNESAHGVFYINKVSEAKFSCVFFFVGLLSLFSYFFKLKILYALFLANNCESKWKCITLCFKIFATSLRTDSGPIRVIFLLLIIDSLAHEIIFCLFAGRLQWVNNWNGSLW